MKSGPESESLLHVTTYADLASALILTNKPLPSPPTFSTSCLRRLLLSWPRELNGFSQTAFPLDLCQEYLLCSPSLILFSSCFRSHHINEEQTAAPSNPQLSSCSPSWLLDWVRWTWEKKHIKYYVGIKESVCLCSVQPLQAIIDTDAFIIHLCWPWCLHAQHWSVCVQQSWPRLAGQQWAELDQNTKLGGCWNDPIHGSPYEANGQVIWEALSK